MQAYIAQRILYAIATFVLITIVVFGSIRLLPGDVVLATFEESGFTASEEQIAAVRRSLGLDRPVVVQYFVWLGNATQGDLGESFISGQPVSRLLRQAVPVTLQLTILSVAISILVSVPLGLIGAMRRGAPVDYLSRIIAIVGITVPSFVLALLSLLIGVRWFGWSPPTRYTPFIDDPRANMSQFVLPALILGYALAASLTRMVRSSVLEVLGKDFVRTARAKGLGSRIVIGRHVMRNALIPVVTLLGLQVSAVLGGSVVIESIYNLPGVGLMLLNGVIRRDYPVIQAGVLIAAVAVLLVNLLVDLSYVLLDPRIRHG